jgi:hypothetical protein
VNVQIRKATPPAAAMLAVINATFFPVDSLAGCGNVCTGGTGGCGTGGCGTGGSGTGGSGTG